MTSAPWPSGLLELLAMGRTVPISSCSRYGSLIRMGSWDCDALGSRWLKLVLRLRVRREDREVMELFALCVESQFMAVDMEGRCDLVGGGVGGAK